MAPGMPRSAASVITYPTSGSASYGQRAFRTSVKLSPRARNQSSQGRLQTLVHELGHAFGLWYHNPTCSSAMYYSTRCGGGGFTRSEQAVLRRN